jgi:hypothetical protein
LPGKRSGAQSVHAGVSHRCCHREICSRSIERRKHVARAAATVRDLRGGECDAAAHVRRGDAIGPVARCPQRGVGVGGAPGAVIDASQQ